MPTGSFEDGLGSSRWLIQPGVTVGLMLADWIQAFPIVSYSFTSKPTTDRIPEGRKKNKYGLTLQSIVPIVFSEVFFVQVTPIYSISDFSNSDENRYIQEVQATYTLTPKFQLAGFWQGVFEDDAHTFRAGLTVFF